MFLKDYLINELEKKRVLAERAKGYAGMLGGAVIGEVPRGYGMLANLAMTGDINQAVDYGNRVGDQFMLNPNDQVMSDMQAAAPYLQKAGDVWEQGMVNAEILGEKLPFIPNLPREAYHAGAQITPELIGVDWTGKGLRAINRALPNIEDMNWRPGMLNNPQMGMVAWHGSPHKHSGRLDPSKIGTGEGAQAYGYGHYLAENKDVAGSYKSMYEKPYVELYDASGARLYNDGSASGDEAWAAIEKAYRKNPDANLQDVANDLRKTDQFAANNIDEMVDAGATPKLGIENEGSLYEYDLPDNVIDDMLDWDAPLSEQQGILKGLGIEQEAKRYSQIQDRLNDLQRQKGGLDSPEWNKLVAESKEIRAKVGYSPYGTGQDLYEKLIGNADKAAASQKLQQLGIPGIKYYDGGSRAAGEGTRNFVIFPGNEDLAKPLTRNGQPLGLPMDEASRMARAREMGFDDDLYHATFNEFDEFKPGHRGASENETSKIGHWFADNPEGTEGFLTREATTYSPQIDPDTGNFRRWDDGELQKFRDPDETGMIMPMKSKAKKPLSFESDESGDAFEKFMDFRDNWADYGDATFIEPKSWSDRYIAHNVAKTNDDFRKYLSEHGYDSVKIINTEYDAPKGKTITQTLIPYGNEDVLRSRFAKFDPSKANSKNILDSWYPYALGGLLGQQFIQDNQAR